MNRISWGFSSSVFDMRCLRVLARDKTKKKKKNKKKKTRSRERERERERENSVTV